MTRTALVAAVLVAALPTATLPTAALPQPAPGAPPIREADAERLANLDAATGIALRQLVVEGDPAQLALARTALKGEAVPADAADLEGEWNCAMTKLGGLLPAVSYPPFRCRIGRDGDRLTFDKLTGSQRTRGTLQMSDGPPPPGDTAAVWARPSWKVSSRCPTRISPKSWTSRPARPCRTWACWNSPGLIRPGSPFRCPTANRS